jgi:hypothetical protein
VVWALTQWAGTHRTMAAVYGVFGAAFLQAVLYMPGVNAIGFASAGTTVAFVAMTVVTPALVFGLLYWKRGLATALVAHASALVALALMI